MSKTILSIFNELSRTSSRNDKITILQAHRDNDLLKQIFFRALTPYEQFYIKKIPSYVQGPVKYDLEYFLSQLERFSSRSVSGHAALNLLTDMLGHMLPEDAVVAQYIIKKDLRCGIQAATVNKVWDELVPIYPCLLAEPFSAELAENIKLPAIVQVKEDGVRVNIICRNGEITVRAAKSGNEMSLHGVLDDTFKELARKFNEDVVFDGEAVVLDKNNNILPRKKGNGIINKTIMGTISEEEAQNIRVRLWDIIPIKDFDNKYCGITYEERLATLYSVVGYCTILDSKCEIVETHWMDNWDKILALFDKVRALDKEGIMIKDGSSVWEDKRIKLMLKMKAQKECELKVVEIIPGENKYTGMVGSLRCVDSTGQLSVNIGSGLSDVQRETLDESVLGQIITARFNEVIRGENKQMYSLYLARLIEFRLDKREADDLDTIMKI